MKTNVLGRLREQGYEQFYWSGRDGTLSDLSKNKSTITPQGGASIGKSERGMSGLFDGNGDYLSVGAISGLNVGTGSISAAAWFKLGGSATTPHIFNIATSASIHAFRAYISGGVLYASTRRATLVETAASNAFTDTSSFHHIAVVRSGTLVYGYLDGLPMTTPTGAGADLDFANHLRLYIGAYDTPALYWFGPIDTVGVWNYSLNNTDVAQIMAETRPWG